MAEWGKWQRPRIVPGPRTRANGLGGVPQVCLARQGWARQLLVSCASTPWSCGVHGQRVGVGCGRVVSNFVVQALHGDSLTIYGDGSPTRSFCFVDDLIEGLVRLGSLESDAASG